MLKITWDEIENLKSSGKWMVRFSNDGVSHDGFKWNQIGEWTEAPDWNTKPVCSGGLFGQNLNGSGYCKPGSRFEFCEIDLLVKVDGEKVKTNKARILAVNETAFEVAVIFGFKGSLDLRDYAHPLPASLTSDCL